MHIGAIVNPVGPEWAEVCMTFVPVRATMTVRCQTCWRFAVLRFLSFLVSPIRTSQRDWRERKRKLDAAFAKGRKIRRDRTGT